MSQNVVFLAALSARRAKTETIDEIAGCAVAKAEIGKDIFEIVGTDADGSHSFNTCTTSTPVAAAGSMKFASTETAPPPRCAVRQIVWKHWTSTSDKAPQDAWNS